MIQLFRFLFPVLWFTSHNRELNGHNDTQIFEAVARRGRELFTAQNCKQYSNICQSSQTVVYVLTSVCVRLWVENAFHYQPLYLIVVFGTRNINKNRRVVDRKGAPPSYGKLKLRFSITAERVCILATKICCGWFGSSSGLYIL